MLETVEGIIITTIDYKESSLILNIITKKYGLIGVISKGCKKIKSPLRSVSTKMTYGNFNIIYKNSKLSILNSVDVIDNFKNIKKDITKISYSAYLLELTNQVLKENNDSSIYGLLITGLKKIDEGYDPLVILNIIELKYLEYLGVMPSLDSCYICGNNEVVTVSNGGYVCNNCLTNEKIVSTKTIKLLRMFYYVDITKISNIDISVEVKKEINNFLNEYYSMYTAIYLKSKKFIDNLLKLDDSSLNK